MSLRIMMNRPPLLASLCGLVGLLLMVIGCNESANSGDAKHSAPPTLALAAQSPGDQQANGVGKNGSADSQIDLKALQKDFEENLEAWDAGKPFDFKPVAEGLSKSLTAGLDVQNYSLARMAARILEMTAAYDQAKQIYSALDGAAAKAGESELAAAARDVAKMGLVRLGWLGKAPKIEGAVFGGEKFDWSKYKDKVVLLDFWATWCGPCLGELPNVKEAYQKYHQKGFEIVGISLDDEPEKLTEFLQKDKLPWTILLEADPAKRGFDDPLVKKFGVDGIPATFLLDRSGKVAAISVRGDELQKQIAKLLAEKK